MVMSGGKPMLLSQPLPWPGLYYQGTTADCCAPSSLEEVYRTHPGVRTCISFLATNIAQIAVHTYRRVGEYDRRRLRDHPVAIALENPWPGVTQYRLLEATVADVAIYAEAYWLKVAWPGQADRIGLRRVPPARLVRIDPDDLGTPATFYFARVDGSELAVPADQLVRFRGYDPLSYRGGSPIVALRELIAEDYEAAGYRQQLWRNGARMSGVLKRPADAPEWSETAKVRFRAEWQAWYTGDSEQAGGTPVLEDGMEYVSGGFTAEQAQYLEARKMTLTQIAAAYHVPPPMVGLLDNANFANVRQFHQSLYQDTLGPWFRMIEQELQASVVTEFDDTEGVYCEFNVADKLRGSFEEQSAALQTAVGAPWMTRSEARARMNLPEREDADQLIVPLNVTGTVPPQGAPPPEPGAASRNGRHPVHA